MVAGVRVEVEWAVATAVAMVAAGVVMVAMVEEMEMVRIQMTKSKNAIKRNLAWRFAFFNHPSIYHFPTNTPKFNQCGYF